MGFVSRLRRDQSGVVESGLVMIPLLVLFLISVDLIIAVNMRNVDLAFVQGRASVAAISAQLGSEEVISSFSFSNSGEDLRIVVAHQSRRIPDLLVGLASFMHLQARSTDVSGVAVMESQR